MDDQKPLTPNETTPEAGEQKPVVPDPHRAEPLPPAQEGMRPEAVASGVRPEQDEPGGPLVGLVAASGAEVADELTPDDDDTGAEELLAMMGVEDEGIEAGQISGIVVAMFVSIFALAVVMYYLFYVPFRDQTGSLAASDVRYEELEVIETQGQTKLSQYARADSAYTLPIDAAMASVAAGYAADGGAVEPRTRSGFNTTMLPPTGYSSTDAASVSVVGSDSVRTAPAAPGLLELDVETNEEVGVDTPDGPFPE